MSDQANKYVNAVNPVQGGLHRLAQAQSGISSVYSGTRLAKVWVAYRDYGGEGKGEPLAVFPTKALADIFMAGAEATLEGSVKMSEVPITWASQ